MFNSSYVGIGRKDLLFRSSQLYYMYFWDNWLEITIHFSSEKGKPDWWAVNHYALDGAVCQKKVSWKPMGLSG